VPRRDRISRWALFASRNRVDALGMRETCRGIADAATMAPAIALQGQRTLP